MRDLIRRTLLDGNGIAGWQRQIECRNWRGDVERNAVLFRQHSHRIRPDFIRHVAIRRRQGDWDGIKDLLKNHAQELAKAGRADAKGFMDEATCRQACEKVGGKLLSCRFTTRAEETPGLPPAIETAFTFDRKLVIEAGVAAAREIECAVLGNDDPVASIPGEIIVTHPDGFYSYDAKYVDASGSSWRIPADLPPALASRVQAMSVEAFKALELSGLARVDFFVDRDSGELFLNEVNTLPGFTAISMYPKMWDASGLPMPALIDRLIALAIERHEERQRLRTSVT